MNSKETLFEVIRNFLIEQEIIPAMFQSMCLLETSKEENLTEILTAIRALQGITVVTMVEPHVVVSSEKHKSVINIKFIPQAGVPMKNYLHSLRTAATNLPGVYSLKFKKIEQMKSQ